MQPVQPRNPPPRSPRPQRPSNRSKSPRNSASASPNPCQFPERALASARSKSSRASDGQRALGVGTPPTFDTPDEDVYLTGRNVMLLSTAGIHCARKGLDRIVIGPLAGNPFPDATPDFFASMSRTLSLGLGHAVAIDAPFAEMHKSDVVRLGLELGVPLELTLSCMNPRHGRHCGQCSKCRERRDAFLEVGVPDATVYVTPPLR